MVGYCMTMEGQETHQESNDSDSCILRDSLLLTKMKMSTSCPSNKQGESNFSGVVTKDATIGTINIGGLAMETSPMISRKQGRTAGDSTLTKKWDEDTECTDTRSESTQKELHIQSVRFHPQSEAQVISESGSWTDEEVRATWYAKEDYERFCLEMAETVTVLAAGLVDIERGGYCFRGIEDKASHLRKNRKYNMRKARLTVFRIQARFDRSRRRRRRCGEDTGSCCGSTASSATTCSSWSSTDDEYAEMWSKANESQEIAEAYGECSFSSRIEAHRLGLWDAKTASILWSEDSLPKLPRRTWAKAG